MSEVNTNELENEERRDFIHIATSAAFVGGAAMVAWPLIDQMNPAADTKALSSLEVDITKIPMGGEIRVLIGGLPFFLRRRTPAEISTAQNVELSKLPDPEADADRATIPEYLIVSGSCTHLGCVPVGPAQGNTGDYGGWYCPCHGSHYDISGRIRKGPAPKNLPVPEYAFNGDNTKVTISL